MVRGGKVYMFIWSRCHLRSRREPTPSYDVVNIGYSGSVNGQVEVRSLRWAFPLEVKKRLCMRLDTPLNFLPRKK